MSERELQIINHVNEFRRAWALHMPDKNEREIVVGLCDKIINSKVTFAELKSADGDLFSKEMIDYNSAKGAFDLLLERNEHNR